MQWHHGQSAIDAPQFGSFFRLPDDDEGRAGVQ